MPNGWAGDSIQFLYGDYILHQMDYREKSGSQWTLHRRISVLDKECHFLFNETKDLNGDWLMPSLISANTGNSEFVWAKNVPHLSFPYYENYLRIYNVEESNEVKLLENVYLGIPLLEGKGEQGMPYPTVPVLRNDLICVSGIFNDTEKDGGLYSNFSVLTKEGKKIGEMVIEMPPKEQIGSAPCQISEDSKYVFFRYLNGSGLYTYQYDVATKSFTVLDEMFAIAISESGNSVIIEENQGKTLAYYVRTGKDSFKELWKIDLTTICADCFFAQVQISEKDKQIAVLGQHSESSEYMQPVVFTVKDGKLGWIFEYDKQPHIKPSNWSDEVNGISMTKEGEFMAVVTTGLKERADPEIHIFNIDDGLLWSGTSFNLMPVEKVDIIQDNEKKELQIAATGWLDCQESGGWMICIGAVVEFFKLKMK